jgi:hypothetical protein
VELSYTITVQLIGAHKSVVGAEVESAIERAATDAVGALLDPDDLDVSVEEA